MRLSPAKRLPWIRERGSRADRVVAVPPDDDTGGPSALTTAYRSRCVEGPCLPPCTAEAARARSNATIGFALSPLVSLVRSPQSRNQWGLSPQPVARLSVGHRQRMSVPARHYNQHRPHRALALRPPEQANRTAIPLRAAPDPQPKRKDLLRGLVHEYEHAA